MSSSLSNVGREVFKLTIFAGAIHLCSENVAQVLPVSGRSMSPTLNPDFYETGKQDLVFVTKYNASQLRRNAIITFLQPTKTDGSISVKRVIGLHGDTVISRRGDKVMIPKGHIWVEGDNAEDSRDSNDYGPISARLVQGQATNILLPFVRARRLRDKEWVASDTRVQHRLQIHKWPEEWDS
ncbi:MAG: hypothetical protein M1814_002716 [Vezdaea aestivalis]|nr:MAG: hypothetical protein M1814_002716 [Vezdaea aestivalis]